jgi:hypothetical protein
MQKRVKIALSFEQAGFRKTIGMMQHAPTKLNQFVKCDFTNTLVTYQYIFQSTDAIFAPPVTISFQK